MAVVAEMFILKFTHKSQNMFENHYDAIVMNAVR